MSVSVRGKDSKSARPSESLSRALSLTSPATATLAQQAQRPRQSTGENLAPRASAQPLSAALPSRLHRL
jgi:hypothetical protein